MSLAVPATDHRLANATTPAYVPVMANDPHKPDSPWRLNSGRIVLLVLGGLLVLITISSMLGGLGDYQQLRSASQEAKTAAEAEPATTP